MAWCRWSGRRRWSTSTAAFERIPYELFVLKALPDAVRRPELYVAGANRWRNPEDDLPADFELNRDVQYSALGQPLDSAEFTAELQRRDRAAVSRLNDAVATAGGVRISNRRGEPWITVPAIEKQPEPGSLPGPDQWVRST
jgi:hypothetical protein